MQNLIQKSPDLAGWIIEEGYGKVLSRPGATLHLRELFSVAMLAATGFPRQFFAHLRALAAMGEPPRSLAVFVRRAAQESPPAVKGRIGKALKHFLAHQNSVWEAPVSGL